jgi:hypothetical protein
MYGGFYVLYDEASESGVMRSELNEEEDEGRSRKRRDGTGKAASGKAEWR